MNSLTRESPQEREHRRAERKAANMRGLMTPSRAVARGVYGPLETATTMSGSGGVGGVGCLKTEAKRNPALLEMARGRECLLRVPDVCQGDTATTVACHSNLSVHGKAGARKADDCYSVWGCAACHRWLDTGPAKAEVKAARFTLAHMDQVIEWRRIASDPGEPVRFRKAAQWALDELNARAA